MRKVAILLLLAGSLGACTAAPAVISDLEEDKVIVQSGMGTPDHEIVAKAREGCRIHGRTAQAISYACLDDYCLRKSYLFACK